jgi:murein DD-endopeptidase MepM/ murein hydrolase activator NlpD
VVGEEKQAQNMRVGLDVFCNDPRVGAAIWFSTQDFPDGGQPEGWNRFGLFRNTGLGQGDAKTAYRTLQEIAAAEPAEPVIPLADGFQYPLGRAGRQVTDDFYIATYFMDPNYYRAPDNGGAWHPGEDWNGLGGGDTDLGEPVYAVAHGRVVASNYYVPSWGNIVLIEHQLPDGRHVWSQYAHLRDRLVAVGDVVSRGQQIGSIGKGDQDRWPAHLHFEIRTQDVPPDAWFPNVRDANWVRANYTNPSAFIASNLAHEFVYKPSRVGQEFIVDTEGSTPAVGTFEKAPVPYWWSAPHGYQGSTLWTYASQVQEENWGVWRPILPEAGRYEVFVYVPSYNATTRNARYQVNHQAGQSAVPVDQNRYYNQWVSLGKFVFNAGNAGSVRLGDVTGETWGQRCQIAFDAVKWVRVLDA